MSLGARPWGLGLGLDTIEGGLRVSGLGIAPSEREGLEAQLTMFHMGAPVHVP